MWNPAAAKDLPAPRDLQQSFEHTTLGSEPSSDQYRQRIAQLELALARVTKQHMAQQNIIQQKEHSLQTLQAAVHRLESNISADRFEEIDEAGMRGPPDAHLHSQQWKSSTPFFLPTPVLSSRPLSTAPGAPRSQVQQGPG